MFYLISQSVYDDNGNCDDTGSKPVIIIECDGENVPKIDALATEFGNRLGKFWRLRTIQQSGFVYGMTDEEKKTAKDLEDRGIGLLPQNDERIAKWLTAFMEKKCADADIDMGIYQIGGELFI